MRYNSTYTVEDLIGTLSEMDSQAPVMVAVQPTWPFEHTITGVVIDCNGIVYLASKQHGYLPQEAKDAFENYGIPFSDR